MTHTLHTRCTRTPCDGNPGFRGPPTPTPTPTRYLAHLTADPNERAGLVETLRCAASLLDGSHPSTGVAQALVAHGIARQLREAAHQLCDHARVHGVRCRYCHALVPSEGLYPSEDID